MRYKIDRPIAQKIQTQADIVFCVDVTGSMQPCINGVKNGLRAFGEGLQSAAAVDYRLRLIAYRDVHDPAASSEPWHIFPFTSEITDFQTQLESLEAYGGGDAPESTLDAIYLGITSPWRARRTHKTIVVLTDADTHQSLSPRHYTRPDNNVHRVVQDFQELRHAMLFIVAPKYPTYARIEQSMRDADRKVVAHWVPTGDERYRGLNGIHWEPLMGMLGQVVSATSVVTQQGEA